MVVQSQVMENKAHYIHVYFLGHLILLSLFSLNDSLQSCWELMHIFDNLYVFVPETCMEVLRIVVFVYSSWTQAFEEDQYYCSSMQNYMQWNDLEKHFTDCGLIEYWSVRAYGPKSTALFCLCKIVQRHVKTEVFSERHIKFDRYQCFKNSETLICFLWCFAD